VTPWAATPAKMARVGTESATGETARAETSSAATPLHKALTARGMATLGGAGMVGVAGFVLGYPALIGLGVAGLAAVAVALGSVARPPRPRVERKVSPDRVSRGSRVVAKVTVSNDQYRTMPAMVAHDMAGELPVPCRIPRLRHGACDFLDTQLPTSHRGIVHSGPLRFHQADAFGLARRVITTGLAADLYVRPRRVELPEVAASLARSLDGADSGAAMDGTLSFSSLREYAPGDELRRVHWRASAHAGKFMVKQFIDTAHAAVSVVLDDRVTVPANEVAAGSKKMASPGMTTVANALSGANAEAFEVAVDCAASIAAVAAALGQPLRLVDAAGESLLPVTARRGGCTVDDVLDALTPVAPVADAAMTAPGAGTPDPMPEALRRLSGSGRGSLAAVVTTRPTAWLGDSLRLLSGSYARVIAIHVTTEKSSALGATHAGRVLWVTVREPEDLRHALLRAQAAA
jgi:uncharacterized protein (DUF58 family)